MTIQSQNFGNRLQNYALQEVLRSMGHGASSARRSRPEPVLSALKRRVRGLVKRDRTSLFRAFDDRYVAYSRDVVAREYVSPGMAEHADAYVMGSDQIWNPTFPFNSELDYLPFLPSHMKIAYAASFGVDRIERDRDLTAGYLRDIRSVSVREDAGARIVRELTGRDVPVVLDPTMLLPAGRWAEIESRPSVPAADGPFCLKYVLGEDANAGRIDALAAERGLALVDLSDASLPVGPAEFVWLVRHAGLVCTDSFHASVFSTLFHRPLVIFERRGAEADMSSRFDTLCRALSLGHHRFNGPGFDMGRCEGEDWGRVDAALAAERERSLAWLAGALEGAGESNG